MGLDRESIDAYVDLTVKGRASDLKVPPNACAADRPVDPCSIVIFGATGDLTRRKLAPSLYNLYLLEALPESFVILGSGRSEMSREQFHDEIKQALKGMDLAKWDDFASRLYYYRVDLKSSESFAELSKTLKKLEGKHDTGSNRIFYLADTTFRLRKRGRYAGKRRALERSIRMAPGGAALLWKNLLDMTWNQRKN